MENNLVLAGHWRANINSNYKKDNMLNSPPFNSKIISEDYTTIYNLKTLRGES